MANENVAREPVAWMTELASSSPVVTAAFLREHPQYRNIYTIPLYRVAASDEPIKVDGGPNRDTCGANARAKVEALVAGYFPLATKQENAPLVDELLAAVGIDGVRVDAEARDAARYRWLKEQDVVWYPPGYNGNPNCYWQVEFLSPVSESLDAAVDAARGVKGLDRADALAKPDPQQLAAARDVICRTFLASADDPLVAPRVPVPDKQPFSK